MNKVFKLKFNKHSKELVVVSELATNYDVSKDSSTSAKLNISSLGKVIASGALAGLALASATAGADTATQVGTIKDSIGAFELLRNTNGVTQIKTTQDNTVLNWNDFNVGLKQAVLFTQPKETSVVLNRVLGQQASQILGDLHSNGKVYLINPNGILFGKGAKVDVAGLIASTLNLTEAQVQEFAKNGKLGELKAAAEAANVINSGVITVKNGNLHLIGGNVLNAGKLVAEKGSIYLSAGNSVTIQDAKNPLVKYSVTAGNKAVNVGTLIAAQKAVVDGKEAHVRSELANGFDKVFKDFSPKDATELKVDAKEGLYLVAETSADVIGVHGKNVKVGKLDVQTKANAGANVRLYNVEATSLDVRSNGDVEVKSSTVSGKHVDINGANSLTVDNSKFEVTGNVEVKKSAKVKFASSKVNARNINVAASDSLVVEDNAAEDKPTFKADNFTASGANKVNFNNVRATVANDLSVSGHDVDLDTFVATAKNATVVAEGVNLNVNNSNLQAQNVLLASDKDVNLANTKVKADKAKIFAFNANVDKGSSLKTAELEVLNLNVAGKSNLTAETKLTVHGETRVKEKSAVSTSKGQFAGEVSVNDSQLTSKNELLFDNSLKVSNGLLVAKSIFVGNDDKIGVTHFKDKSRVQATSFFSGNEKFSADLTVFDVSSFNVDAKKILEFSNADVNAEEVRLNSEENLTLVNTRVNANYVGAFADKDTGELLLKGPNTKVLSKGALELEALITTLTDGATAKGETTKVSGAVLLVQNASHLETNNSIYRHDLDLSELDREAIINEEDGSTAITFLEQPVVVYRYPAPELTPKEEAKEIKTLVEKDEGEEADNAIKKGFLEAVAKQQKDPEEEAEQEIDLLETYDSLDNLYKKYSTEDQGNDSNFKDQTGVYYSDPEKDLTSEEESKEVENINKAADLEDLKDADKKLEEESTKPLKDDKEVETGYVETTEDLGKVPYEDHLGTLSPEEEKLLAALDAEELEKESNPGDNLSPLEGPTETTAVGGTDTADALDVDNKKEKDTYVMTPPVAITEDPNKLSEEDKEALADTESLAEAEEAAKAEGAKEGDHVPGINFNNKVEKEGYVTASTTDEPEDEFVVANNAEESSEETSNEAFMLDLIRMITPEVAEDEEKQKELVAKYPKLKKLIEEQVAAKKKVEENAITQPDGKNGPDTYVVSTTEPSEEELEDSLKELLDKDAELAKAEEEARLKEDMEDLEKAGNKVDSDKTPIYKELVVNTGDNSEDNTQEFEPRKEPEPVVPKADSSDEEHAVYVEYTGGGEGSEDEETLPKLVDENGNEVEPQPVDATLLPKSGNGNPVILDEKGEPVNEPTSEGTDTEENTTKSTVSVPESPTSQTQPATPAAVRTSAVNQATDTAKDTNDALKGLGNNALPTLGDVPSIPSTGGVSPDTNFADALAANVADGNVTLPGATPATTASRVSFASARPSTSSSQATASKATEGKKAGKVTLASGKRSCGAVLDEVYDKYRVKDDDRDIEYFVQNVTKYKIRPFDQQKVRKVCTIDDEPKVPAKVAKVEEKSADTTSESTGE